MIEREYVCVLNPTGQVVRKIRCGPEGEWETDIFGGSCVEPHGWKDVWRELGLYVEDQEPIVPGDVVAASGFSPRRPAAPLKATGGVSIDSGTYQKAPHFLEIGNRVKGRKLQGLPVYEAHVIKSESLGTRRPRGGLYHYWRPLPGQYEDERPIEVTICNFTRRVQHHPSPRRKEAWTYWRANLDAVYIGRDTSDEETPMSPDMERRIASMPLGNWKAFEVLADGLVIHELPDNVSYRFSEAELRIGAAVPDRDYGLETKNRIATIKRVEVRALGCSRESIVLVWLDDPRLKTDGPYHLKSCVTAEGGETALRTMYENRVGWDLYREWQREQSEFLEWKHQRARP